MVLEIRAVQHGSSNRSGICNNCSQDGKASWYRCLIDVDVYEANWSHVGTQLNPYDELHLENTLSQQMHINTNLILMVLEARAVQHGNPDRSDIYQQLKPGLKGILVPIFG